MTVSFQPNRMNPDVYAQQFATQNGISLTEAKSQLKTKYGDPSKEMGESIFSNSSSQTASEDSYFDIDSEFDDASVDTGSIKDLFQQFLNLLRGNEGPQKEGDPLSKEESGENVGGKGQDPDEYAQEYADENNMTLEEAKEELQSLYGTPEKGTYAFA